MIISDFEKKYIYDCKMCLPYMQECIKQPMNMLFHFLQPNHFAFDSMLFDGKNKTLVFFQITINEDHEIHFNQIKDFINCQPEKIKHKEKYISFFSEVKKQNLVTSYFFQWLTNKKYDAIIKKSKDFNEIDKGTTFWVYPFDERLIDQIEKK